MTGRGCTKLATRRKASDREVDRPRTDRPLPIPRCKLADDDSEYLKGVDSPTAATQGEIKRPGFDVLADDVQPDTASAG